MREWNINLDKGEFIDVGLVFFCDIKFGILVNILRESVKIVKN